MFLNESIYIKLFLIVTEKKSEKSSSFRSRHSQVLGLKKVHKIVKNST